MALPGSGEPPVRRGPPWLAIARGLILLITLLSSTAYARGLVYYYQRLFIPDVQRMAGSDLTIQQMHEYMTTLNLPVAYYAWFSVIFMGALGFGYVVVALLLLWYKPNDRMALFTALILALFGTGFAPVLEFVSYSFQDWAPLLEAYSTIGFTLLFLLYLTFPDGRFAPRWTVWIAVVWVLENFINQYWPSSPLSMFNYPDPWGLLFVLLSLGFFLSAQIYRYYHKSTPLQRQQTRWVVVGLLIAGLAFPLPWLIVFIFPQLASESPLGLLSDAITTLVYGFAFLQIPISLGIAISRYHLWDIDVLLRRTVLYSLLTVTLALIYLLAVVLLQFLFDLVFQAGDSPLVTVLSTLAIAALFNPLRRRIQVGIDSRFYRRKQDTARALAVFHARLQKDIDLHHLPNALRQVVMESIQPESVSVWIRPESARPEPDRGKFKDPSQSDAFRNDRVPPDRANGVIR